MIVVYMSLVFLLFQCIIDVVGGGGRCGGRCGGRWRDMWWEVVGGGGVCGGRWWEM